MEVFTAPAPVVETDHSGSTGDTQTESADAEMKVRTLVWCDDAVCLIFFMLSFLYNENHMVLIFKQVLEG